MTRKRKEKRGSRNQHVPSYEGLQPPSIKPPTINVLDRHVTRVKEEEEEEEKEGRPRLPTLLISTSSSSSSSSTTTQVHLS
ncbi:unnamed protein product [Pleuronectes platessa]|uniref:Uncharacterized protein n=1 Tax=Pleuronectes platessa TaxID=8262 RepID=A0A9N7UVH6_PLEPL|nr:unnamed protein product [Pleuronectes platessa]